MRGTLLTTVAALALATPAMAADLGYIPPIEDPVYSPAPLGVVGHLQLGLGMAFFDEDFFLGDDNVGLFEGWGRVNVPFAGDWNLELETGGTAFFEDGFGVSTIGAYAHLWKGFGNARIGALGGVTFGSGFFISPTIGTVGLEGEYDIGNVTLGAQGTYNFSDSDFDFDYWGLRGWADWYFTPDTKVGAELAWWDVDYADVWGAALDVEHRFSGTPVSAYGQVGYQNVDFDFGGDSDVWTAMVGVRVFMDGGMTLQDHDRQVPFDVKGPSFVGGPIVPQ